MKGSPVIIISVSVLLLLIPIAISSPMDGELEKSGDGAAAAAAVHIVYVSRPEGEDAEAFHIKTLASVLGSEEAAREAIVYHYTHAASGFSAKLTPKQVSDLSQKPEVLQVVPSRTYQLHGSSAGGVRPGLM